MRAALIIRAPCLPARKGARGLDEQRRRPICPQILESWGLLARICTNIAPIEMPCRGWAFAAQKIRIVRRIKHSAKLGQSVLCAFRRNPFVSGPEDLASRPRRRDRHAAFAEGCCKARAHGRPEIWSMDRFGTQPEHGPSLGLRRCEVGSPRTDFGEDLSRRRASPRQLSRWHSQAFFPPQPKLFDLGIPEVAPDPRAIAPCGA